MEENVRGIHFHSGPALLRWRRGIAAGVGAILQEDIPDYLETVSLEQLESWLSR